MDGRVEEGSERKKARTAFFDAFDRSIRNGPVDGFEGLFCGFGGCFAGGRGGGEEAGMMGTCERRHSSRKGAEEEHVCFVYLVLNLGVRRSLLN